jgi:hypothetical protein
MSLSSWLGVLYYFTRCRLTFPTDMLIALSALANDLSVMLKPDYVAGMWSSQLPQVLLRWVTRYHREEGPQSPEYTAQS